MASKRILSEKDIDLIEEAIDRKLDEKLDEKLVPFRSEIMNAISEVMGELKAIKENQEIGVGRRRDIENRVEKLERIHPGGRHVAA